MLDRLLEDNPALTPVPQYHVSTRRGPQLELALQAMDIAADQKSADTWTATALREISVGIVFVQCRLDLRQELPRCGAEMQVRYHQSAGSLGATQQRDHVRD